MEIDASASPTSQFAWRRSVALGLSLRPFVDTDLPFLVQVYASTRTQELAHVPWTESQKAAFLDMQFQAQHAHYQKHYPTAHWLVIAREDDSIGRLYLDRWAREHRLIDIALLPEHRGQGYGMALLQDLIDEAAAAGKPLSIHVEKNNPAMTLYRRLGFRPIGEHGVYDLLEVRRGEESGEHRLITEHAFFRAERHKENFERPGRRMIEPVDRLRHRRLRRRREQERKRPPVVTVAQILHRRQREFERRAGTCQPEGLVEMRTEGVDGHGLKRHDHPPLLRPGSDIRIQSGFAYFSRSGGTDTSVICPVRDD